MWRSYVRGWLAEAMALVEASDEPRVRWVACLTSNSLHVVPRTPPSDVSPGMAHCDEQTRSGIQPAIVCSAMTRSQSCTASRLRWNPALMFVRLGRVRLWLVAFGLAADLALPSSVLAQFRPAPV